MSPSTTVYKYPLPPNAMGQFDIPMPDGAEILRVAMDTNTPFVCLWARVDPVAPMVPRKLYLAGTGHHLEEGVVGNYIGSFNYPNADFLWHLFERRV